LAKKQNYYSQLGSHALQLGKFLVFVGNFVVAVLVLAMAKRGRRRIGQDDDDDDDDDDDVVMMMMMLQRMMLLSVSQLAIKRLFAVWFALVWAKKPEKRNKQKRC